jgi:hypothetical protein
MLKYDLNECNAASITLYVVNPTRTALTNYIPGKPFKSIVGFLIILKQLYKNDREKNKVIVDALRIFIEADRRYEEGCQSYARERSLSQLTALCKELVNVVNSVSVAFDICSAVCESQDFLDDLFMSDDDIRALGGSPPKTSFCAKWCLN